MHRNTVNCGNVVEKSASMRGRAQESINKKKKNLQKKRKIKRIHIHDKYVE